MTRMTLKHVEAVSHAKLFCEPMISKNPEPRFRHAIEKDILLLDEVRMFLLKEIYEPKLPTI